MPKDDLMFKFAPAPKPRNGDNITHGLNEALYPAGSRVQNGTNGRPEILIEFHSTERIGVVLPIQGAAVLARQLRQAVRQYLHPEKTGSGETE